MAARGDRFGTCSLCPRLCRHACPVATGSAREAAVPALIAGVLLAWERSRSDRDSPTKEGSRSDLRSDQRDERSRSDRDSPTKEGSRSDLRSDQKHVRVSDAEALEVATLCVDCGACRDVCHLHVPLPEHLRVVRSQLAPPVPIEPLRPVEGQGALVAVETDERPLAAILQGRLGRDVARWPTGDRLGVAALESPGWDRHAAALRAQAGSRQVVLADGGAASALGAAGVAYVWAAELLGVELGSATSSCVLKGGKVGDRLLACCGGAGPLARHHPEDARRVAHRFWDGRPVADARCRAHLREAGLPAEDWLDHFVREEP
jgi:ferredoxin